MGAKQPAPRMPKIEVGTILYEVSINRETGGHELCEWHVRTIRGETVHMVEKTKWTWIKLSTKNGDYGWAPRIEDWARRSFPVGGPVPDGFSTTKRGAYLLALGPAEDAAKRINKLVASLKAQVTREEARRGPSKKRVEDAEPKASAPAEIETKDRGLPASAVFASGAGRKA